MNDLHACRQDDEVHSPDGGRRKRRLACRSLLAADLAVVLVAASNSQQQLAAALKSQRKSQSANPLGLFHTGRWIAGSFGFHSPRAIVASLVFFPPSHFPHAIVASRTEKETKPRYTVFAGLPSLRESLPKITEQISVYHFS
jgi:hypothetical protein